MKFVDYFSSMDKTQFLSGLVVTIAAQKNDTEKRKYSTSLRNLFATKQETASMLTASPIANAVFGTPSPLVPSRTLSRASFAYEAPHF